MGYAEKGKNNMQGSDKQKEWAERLLQNWRAGAQVLHRQKDTDEKAAAGYEYAVNIWATIEGEERAWIVIDTLKGTSNDPEKAARQIRYKATHQNEADAKKAGAET